MKAAQPIIPDKGRDHFINALRDSLRGIGVREGDTLFISSDITFLMYNAMQSKYNGGLDGIIDLLQELVGTSGNLIFPTYNWGFCKGKKFDYDKTPSETGSLTECARRRSDFVRTQHPFYSCAVWGKDRDLLYNNNYRDSFGPESIFAWLERKGAKNLFINVPYEHSATFIHFVEERCGVPYRFIKEFTAEYKHPDGHESRETYSMFVRPLDQDVENTSAPMGEIFQKKGAVCETMFGDSYLRLLDMRQAFALVEQDIRFNNSGRISTYPGNLPAITAGKQMYALVKRLFPICRSITGEGTRETLRIIREQIPELQIHEVPSGTQVMDWVVPPEWNIHEGWIKNSRGETIIDFQQCNLHIMGYSTPVHTKMTRAELSAVVHTLPEQPDLIPYITSYYKENYGFCMSEKQWQSLPEDEYEIYINSTLTPGSLTYADLVLPGESDEEIMFSTYVCHPSMANNELSGPAVATQLAKALLREEKHRYTYRFVFAPETIGSITYLSRHLEHLKKHLKAGYVLTCCGDCGEFSYVPSRYANTYADKVAQHLLHTQLPTFKAYSFLDRGSDERQYCSPGVDLPVCSVMRTRYGVYPEYHTSGDDLDLVSASSLAETYEFYMKIVRLVEADGYYKMKCLCEPQLGKRGLYPNTSTKQSGSIVRDMMNCIAYMDGKNDLIDIAERINVPALQLIPYIQKMLSASLAERL